MGPGKGLSARVQLIVLLQLKRPKKLSQFRVVYLNGKAYKVTISHQGHTPIANFVDSDWEDDLFHGLLSATKISGAPAMELQDEYIKFISKEKDDDICNPL